MEGIRFHQEFLDKSRRKSAGNVVAVIVNNRWLVKIHGGGYDWIYGAVGSVFSRADSPVASTGVSQTFLSERTKRISEEKARRIHPELFKYLDQ